MFCQTKGCALIQCLDNLLVCAPTEEQCRSDSLSLGHLSAEEHKVSLSKPQWVQEKIIILGCVLTAEDKILSTKRIETIPDYSNLESPPKRNTVQSPSMYGHVTKTKTAYVHFSASVNFTTSTKPHKQGVPWKHRLCWLQRYVSHHCAKTRWASPRRVEKKKIPTRNCMFYLCCLWSKVVLNLYWKRGVTLGSIYYLWVNFIHRHNKE